MIPGPEGYYAAPAPAPSPMHHLETRSSSVSSTSSSASYARPYGAVLVHQVGVLQPLSPPLGVSEPAAAGLMYPRGHYSGFAHDHTHAIQAQPASVPSHFLQAQFAPALPIHPPMPTPRPTSRHSPPYGGYAVDPLPQHPSSVWDQAHDHHVLYSPLSTADYHYGSSAPSPPYDTSALVQDAPTVKECKQKSWFLEQLQRLPPSVIANIREHLGWDECCRVYDTCIWFLHNFQPRKLPKEMILVGLLEQERSGVYYRPIRSSDAPASGTAKAKNKSPESSTKQVFLPVSTCYHCYRHRRVEKFELFNWSRPSARGRDDGADGAEGTTTASSSPVLKQEQIPTPPSSTSGRTPPPPSANPHYDPTLTRSSLMASRPRRGGGTGGRGGTGQNVSPRIKETMGVRRFCLDCGLKLGYYSPGNLVEVQDHDKERFTFWVCGCRRFLDRAVPGESDCRKCGKLAPLSNPAMSG